MQNTIPTLVDAFGSEVQLHDRLTLTYAGELKTGHLEVSPFLYFVFDTPTAEGVSSATIGQYPANQWLLDHGAELNPETGATTAEINESIGLLSKLLHFQKDFLTDSQREKVSKKLVELTEKL